MSRSLKAKRVRAYNSQNGRCYYCGCSDVADNLSLRMPGISCDGWAASFDPFFALTSKVYFPETCR